MKLTALNNRQLRQTSNKQNKQNKQQNVNFKGYSDTIVKMWQIIDSSRGIQFTVEDMLGTNFPRTISGAMSGYEYTGKINWPYLWQEGIREFLTGPTMTLAPIGILAAITKFAGKSSNVHKDNIINLSHLTGQLGKEPLTEETFRKEFTKTAVSDILTQSTLKDAEKSDVEELTGAILDYYSASKSAKTKQEKNAVKTMLSGIDSTFERILKLRKDSYKDTDFQTVTYSTIGNKTGKASFTNYVDYIKAYADDFVKENKNKDGLINLSEKAVKEFKDVRCGGRVLTVISMILGTGVIMSFIPKLYTLASGGVNPGGKAFYDEAAKREGK